VVAPDIFQGDPIGANTQVTPPFGISSSCRSAPLKSLDCATTFTSDAFPPIYGADSSPFDSDSVPTTDYEECLVDLVGAVGMETSDDEMMASTLENAFHASQLLDMILDVRKWALRESTQQQMPLVSESVLQGLTQLPLDEMVLTLENSVIQCKWFGLKEGPWPGRTCSVSIQTRILNLNHSRRK